MFQDFTTTARPDLGPTRLADLRAAMSEAGLDGFMVPRADAHQGEYVAACDERLSWLTGFTGSAGFCIVLHEIAGVFVDGRYRTQVKDQVASVFTPVDWPEVLPGPWLAERLSGGRIGFDPTLYTVGQIEAIDAALQGTDIALVPCDNLVDRVWKDRPAPPSGMVSEQPLDFAGESHADKRARLGAGLQQDGHGAAVITLPDEICWLLNIRGTDIARNPLAQGFAVLHASGLVDLWMGPEKLSEVRTHLGEDVTIHPQAAFWSDVSGVLQGVKGPVRLDKAAVPVAVKQALDEAGVEYVYGPAPCALPKARKNETEIKGMQEAHLRDGAAVVEFLSWFDAQEKTTLTEIDLVQKLEECRRATNALLEISFDTIAGAGPNGAIMHYRVTEDTNRQLQSGDLIVLDSGGQYRDGTTDITRTLAVGSVEDTAKRAFTRVLQGMIAVLRQQWPAGLAGSHIEAIGRAPLWNAGQDFDHGLGHGVGAYLCVHEGPQRLSRAGDVPLEPGMILSNEPGYYRPGAFGIRIENLVVVEGAPRGQEADVHRAMLRFRTLTFVPVDRNLLVQHMLTRAEVDWLNAYHDTCRDVLKPRLAAEAQLWLDRATAPL
ncbi:aminopeptidase P family protein [Shimia haliotis]|uniref:Xaa-Pro aminopeptidase n=1 Tax=Shimia haliotis TaxID=1280847 RepID=A0A1I4A7P4_9RHOB|nr:aminopeptidase P family protein [Shimia haliotis]SFK52220.1 Xaa-Pro aminopeptidase [Shimia haliotis]